jgi:hypothetical protein
VDVAISSVAISRDSRQGACTPGEISKKINNNVDNDDILSTSTTNNMHSSQSPSPVSPMSSSFSTTVNLTGVTAIPISTTAKQHVNSVKIADYLEHAIEALLRNSCSSSNITNNNNNNNHSQLTIANSTSVSKQVSHSQKKGKRNSFAEK